METSYENLLIYLFGLIVVILIICFLIKFFALITKIHKVRKFVKENQSVIVNVGKEGK